MEKSWNLGVFPLTEATFGELIFKVLKQFIYFATDVWKEDKKTESIVWGATQLCAAVRVFINEQQHPISHKKYS